MKPMIYLDNAATTPLSQVVFDSMCPFFTEKYFNPSASYDVSYELNDVIEDAKETIADTIGCEADEIYITSGGTESDNWALHYAKPGDHIITSNIEHHAVLNTCHYLETQGIQVTYLDANRYGRVLKQDVENAINDNTALISIMTVNNELGTIENIFDIGEIAKRHQIVFHTDAVQAYGHMKINVKESNIGMFSASAHKFNGPKGIGFLYVNKNIQLPQMMYGGGQQFGKRPGTENVPGIIGMAEAARIAYENLNENWKYIEYIRDYMQNKIENTIQNISVNGYSKDSTFRMPSYLNVLFHGVRGEQLITLLSMNGIYASTGSACNSSSGEPSHVLKAIGLTDEDANSSIRFTLSENNTIEEIDYVVDVLKRCVDDLRRFS